MPTLLVFTSDDCAACKESTAAIRNVAERFDGALNVGRVQVQQEQQLATRHNVQTYPTYVFLRPDGSVVRLHEGSLEYPELSDFVKECLKPK